MIQSCGQVDMNEQLDGNASYDPFMGTPPRPYDGQAFEYPGGGCNPHEHFQRFRLGCSRKFRGVRADRVAAERWGLPGWRAGEWALEQQHGGHLLRRLLVRRHTPLVPSSLIACEFCFRWWARNVYPCATISLARL